MLLALTLSVSGCETPHLGLLGPQRSTGPPPDAAQQAARTSAAVPATPEPGAGKGPISIDPTEGKERFAIQARLKSLDPLKTAAR